MRVLNKEETAKLQELYKEIFDDAGMVKKCGRAKCIELIKLMTEYGDASDFGNIDTGMMNVPKIKRTYAILTDPYR